VQLPQELDEGIDMTQIFNIECLTDFSHRSPSPAPAANSAVELTAQDSMRKSCAEQAWSHLCSEQRKKLLTP
jgi:hypothetical protein